MPAHTGEAVEASVESSVVSTTEQRTASDSDPDSDSAVSKATNTKATTFLSSPTPTPSSFPERTRNQAPGIPDRRRSLRPAKSSSRRKSSGISIRVTSVADMASEMRLKETDDESDGSHKAEQDNETDTFEDATSTPRPMSQEVDIDVDAGAAEDTTDQDHDSKLVHGDGDEHPVKKEDAGSKKPSRPGSPVRITHGLSGDVALPVQPPPSTTERRQNLESRGSAERVASPPPPPGFARKASSGFGALLGRMGSIRKPARSPPASRQERFGFERRNTAVSMASSNGEAVSGQDGLKPSLQDQFSSLRRQGEFGTPETNGHVLHEQDETPTHIPSSGDSIASPRSSPRKENGRVRSPTLNSSLPPGTASGMSAGPAPEPMEVNWDLWQQVVYEGPSAVSRTSGDELHAAITAGIPPAIRGVVWQVLAESKNEELENIYRILKARGTEAEQKPQSSRAGSIVGINGTSTEKDGVASDSSSQHSNHSTSAASGLASPPTSVDSHVPELQSKLLAEKQKREAASLQKLEKAIKRDMGSRTSYSKYTQSAGLQDGLFGVCKAYALFDEGVGYAQGINFIAMPLLFNMAEEEAFTLLVRLMSKYDLRSMFTPDMRGLHLRLYQFERLLEEYEPAVYCHLKRRNVEPQLYATQWFLTLFVYRFPLQLTLRIYDLILSEGLTAILKFGIVLIQQNRQALLEIKDMSQLTNFLKERLFDVYIDKSPSASSLLDSGFFGSVTGGVDKELYRADDMVRDACNIKLSDETLKAYSLEWEESQRVEREREAELENLRISNASLTTRIRALEERAQTHDAEHVTIAQDLVTLKVENDKLRDDNEGLEMQVQELQKMVDAQPAEVEARLKAEMDRIMTRNIEVQNENRGLKEEMDEMEHELVNAKMAHAQAQADHDTLKQKWNSVQAMLNEKQ